LVLFVLVYAIVFSAGIYYINRLIAKGIEGSYDRPQTKAGSTIAAAGPIEQGR
jgi:hypothetical protein